MSGVGVCNRDGNQHHRAWQQWRDGAVGSDRIQWAFPILDAGLWARRRTCLSGNPRRTGHADVHVSTLLLSALVSLGVRPTRLPMVVARSAPVSRIKLRRIE